MYLVVFTIILILFCLSLIFYTNQNFTNKKPNPCTDFLSDKEFLEHMIPHHQVAVDMSVLLQPISKNPIMHELFRKIIWQQNYEIEVMKEMIGKLPCPIGIGKIEKNYEKSKLSYYFPLKTKAKDGNCDPLFFKPNDHAKHMEHMKQTDKSYLEHMIPHHQVAVDMCHRLLKHTKNDFLRALCYDIIREQEYEILKMNELLESYDVWQYDSKLIN
tara:strand:+ start:45 stop:689 length:645 start_codon:yes stop_codon:yes gene_type:complete